MIPRCRIDPETLREVLENGPELAAWLDAGPADPVAAGVAARLLGRLGRAEKLLSAALAANPSVRARVRLAIVYQWQGRLSLAEDEFRACLDSDDHFAWQHAGKCAYEAGDWALARDRFAAAVRLRDGLEDPELAVSSRLGWDAADACATAAEAATELHRLVPPVHRAALTALAGPPEQRVLRVLGGLRRTSPEVLRGILRYHPDGTDTALTELARDGFLQVDGDIVVTPLGEESLRALAACEEAVAAELWPAPDAALALIRRAVEGAGPSEGPVFAAVRELERDGCAAVRLFDRLYALRHHRADAHAAAWRSEGLTAEEVVALPAGTPQRGRIETATDRVASRAYRPLSPADRAAVLDALRALPSEEP